MSKGSRSNAPHSGISVGDIVHVLLKHKWKLIVITLLGWAAAGSFYFFAPPSFISMAKLMVRYVVERSELDHVENTSSTSASREGESVMLSEVEILTSWDLAEKVAAVPGMEKLLPKSSDPVKPGAVAGIIADGVAVKGVQGSNVIQVSFKNRNPEMAQRVLDELIRQYFMKHLDVHRSKEAAKFVTEKVEQSRTKLRGAEEDVTKMKVDNGILSLPDAMKTLIEQQARTELELSDSEATLAEQRARVATLERFEKENAGKTPLPGTASSPPRPADSVLEVRPALPAPARDFKSSISPASSASETPAEAATVPKPTLVDINHYQGIQNGLFELRSADVKLAEKWKPESLTMRQHKAQVAKLEAERDEMLKKFPEFGVIAAHGTGTVESPASRMDLLAERAQFDALEAKVGNLREALTSIHKKVSDLTLLAPKIMEKERTAALEEVNYRYMGSSLEKAQIDEALDSSKIPNISIVQEATPPLLDMKRRNQVTLGIAAAVPALSIGLALLFGLILNKTVKRPQELELRLGLPLVLSIPWFSKRSVKRLPLAKENTPAGRAELKLTTERSPWEKGHFMLPYAEAVRDRLFAFFDSEGLYVKTKLIGVTSFSPGAGASTLSASLAAALSDIDANKVLLVDMNGGHGASHAFFGGKPTTPSAEDLAPPPEEEQEMPPVGEEDDKELELAKVGFSTNGHSHGNGMSALLNGNGALGLGDFRRMMGKLKPSGYDYVVFDMPPVGAISPSAAMAGLMDHVLAVVESEATITDHVKCGYRDLVAAHATVSVVFNKVRTYGPASLAGV